MFQMPPPFPLFAALPLIVTFVIVPEPPNRPPPPRSAVFPFIVTPLSVMEVSEFAAMPPPPPEVELLLRVTFVRLRNCP